MRHGVAKRKLCEKSRGAGATFTQVWTAVRESATRPLGEACRKRLKGAMTNLASAQLTWDADLLLRFDFERMQVVHDLLSRVPGFPRQIVDLGCGPGTSTRMLVDRFPGAEITGVDISEPMLAVAAERAPGASFAPNPLPKGERGSPQFTPSFFCKLVEDVVYWNTSRLSG